MTSMNPDSYKLPTNLFELIESAIQADERNAARQAECARLFRDYRTARTNLVRALKEGKLTAAEKIYRPILQRRYEALLALNLTSASCRQLAREMSALR